MDLLWLLLLLLLMPLTLFVGYLILSSCLGDSFRARIAGFSIDPRGAYDENYLRTMTNSGHGMSEQIELEDMMFSPQDSDYD